MDKVINKLQATVNFLSPYLPLVNSHMVEFFSENLWEAHVPSKIKTEFLQKYWNNGNIVDIFLENISSEYSELGKFMISCSAASLEKNDIIVDISNLMNDFKIKKCFQIDYANIDTFMSEKKVHEVKVMSDLVANLMSATNATHIIDIGDGKGYLSSYLSLKHKLKVLGLDSSTSVTAGAAKRAHKLEKQWKSAYKKLQYSDKELSNNIKCSHTIEDKCYIQVTKEITSDTDLRAVLIENFPDDNDYKFGLVGLHTCGNLSSVCLKQFLLNKCHVPFLLNIGCCYHLLEEEDPHTSTFPLSNFLKEVNFKLGRNARMLSLQAPSRIFASKKIPLSLMFRAVFEAFVEEKTGKFIGKSGEVGRIGSKCSSFVEYSRKAFKKLELDLEVSDEEMSDFFEKYSSSQQFLEFYFMLRVAVAPVIENIILLDRLLYLQENGIEQSFLVKVFDSYISPRCYGIVGITDK